MAHYVKRLLKIPKQVLNIVRNEHFSSSDIPDKTGLFWGHSLQLLQLVAVAHDELLLHCRLLCLLGYCLGTANGHMTTCCWLGSSLVLQG